MSEPQESPPSSLPQNFLQLIEGIEFTPTRAAEDEPRAKRLHRLRHSAAHLMAEAVLQVFPEAKVATGPEIEHGF